MTVRKCFVAMVGIGALLGCGPSAASAQEATEMYVPVGQSPGLSGKYTVVGKIESVNAQDQTITLVGAGGTWSAKVTGRTKIWLDRSKLRLTNLAGRLSDLRQGSTVEVKPEGHERKPAAGPAEWIKVQVLASP